MNRPDEKHDAGLRRRASDRPELKRQLVTTAPPIDDTPTDVVPVLRLIRRKDDDPNGA